MALEPTKSMPIARPDRLAKRKKSHEIVPLHEIRGAGCGRGRGAGCLAIVARRSVAYAPKTSSLRRREISDADRAECREILGRRHSNDGRLSPDHSAAAHCS